MSKKKETADRSQKLRSALRDNLKKRKQQVRKLGSSEEESSVKLRNRDLSAREDGTS